MSFTKRVVALVLALGALRETAQAQEQEEGPVDVGGSAEASGSISSSGSSASSGENHGWGEVYQAKPREEEAEESEDNDSPTSSGDIGKLRIYGGFRLDVGGGFVAWQNDDYIERAAVTPAIQAGADYVAWKYLALGLETRLNWSRVRAASTRLMLWDLVFKPRVRMEQANGHLEFYAATPVGLTISNFPDDLRVKTTGKAHATIGLSGGVNYFFSEHVGLNVEMGWLWHWVRAEVGDEDANPATPDVGSRTQRLGQWSLLNVNLLFAL